MQTKQNDGAGVKRNMDYARELLLRMEEDPEFDGMTWFPGDLLLSEGHSFDELAYHLNLLDEAGFITIRKTAHMPLISKLTWNGHEFLDDTRDPGIWAEAQEKAKAVAGAGLALLWELAKAGIRKRLGL